VTFIFGLGQITGPAIAGSWRRGRELLGSFYMRRPSPGRGRAERFPPEAGITKDLIFDQLRYLSTRMKEPITIRNALPSDIDAIIALDDVGPKEEKPAYWRRLRPLRQGRKKDRIFLVAETGGEVVLHQRGGPGLGVRLAPVRWVFALAVSPDLRGMGIGKRMFEETAGA